MAIVRRVRKRAMALVLADKRADRDVKKGHEQNRQQCAYR